MLAEVSTAQVPRLSPACLPGLYAADTITRSGMTSSSALPDTRFGSPRRASWLGAIHARRAQSQHPGPILLSHSVFTISLRLSPTSYPTFHPTPQHCSPKRPPSVSVSPITHGILAVLRWPARGRPAIAPQVSAVRVLRGFCLGSDYQAEPASRRRGLLHHFDAVRIGSGILPESCTVEEMVFGELARGGELLAGLFGSRVAWRGAGLVFRMVVGTRGSARLFFSGMVSRREEKM